MKNIFLTFLLAATGAPAYAGVEGDIRTSVIAAGYKCTDVPNRDGVFCVGSSGPNYILIPNDLARLNKLVFYAHGLTGACGPGASGEDFLKDRMAKLKKMGAVAVLPYRRDGLDMSFPFSSYIQNMERILGVKNPTWSMAGHSAGGEFLSNMLAKNPSVLMRVDKVLLLDAAFCIVHNASPCNARPVGVVDNWLQVLKTKRIEIRSYSSTTYSKAESLKKQLDDIYPGVMTNQQKSEGHCPMTKYFEEL